MAFELLHGNCLDVMRGMEDNSVDSIVTDPPYGLSFMGKKWDYDVPSVEIWCEVLRVLKPGGHLLSFAGSRTYHRMAVNIEDAGFEIRDQIMWLYGSGFPKSHNISKAIDKAAGAGRKFIGVSDNVRPNSDRGNGLAHGEYGRVWNETKPATPEAKQWEGWGTALKPAHEPIVVARKPLIGTIVENVLEHGTGGLNIDGCRVATDDKLSIGSNKHEGNAINFGMKDNKEAQEQNELGRFPTNLIHDGSDEVVSLFPQTNSGTAKPRVRDGNGNELGQSGGWNKHNNKPTISQQYGDGGSAARFFYCAKTSKSEREAGLEGFEEKKQDPSRKEGNPGGDNPRNRGVNKRKNHHPTVKPVDLMKYLCRLVTPPNGIVLDPFMGSGSTGIAASQEGFAFIGIEMDEEYLHIARHRIAHWVEIEEVKITNKRAQRTLF